jgi:RNA polymerase sigma-70 factor (ECF subfamily)
MGGDVMFTSKQAALAALDNLGRSIPHGEAAGAWRLLLGRLRQYSDGLLGDQSPESLQLVSVEDRLDRLLGEHHWRPGSELAESVRVVLNACQFASPLRTSMDGARDARKGMGERTVSIDRPCPDFALVVKEGRWDRSCADRLAACFRAPLLRFARSRCQHPELAEDTVQDAMLQAIQEIHAFRGEASVATWLHRLVLSACSRNTRGRKHDPAWNLPLDLLPEEAGELCVPPAQEASLLHRESMEFLRGLFGSLPELDRSLLHQHEGEGLSLKELAERFGLSVDAVKGRLKRARARARQVERPGPGAVEDQSA